MTAKEALGQMREWYEMKPINRSRLVHMDAWAFAIEAELKAKDAEIETAWGIIANAGGGDWSRESVEWNGAAHRWGVKNGFRQG